MGLQLLKEDDSCIESADRGVDCDCILGSIKSEAVECGTQASGNKDTLLYYGFRPLLAIWC